VKSKKANSDAKRVRSKKSHSDLGRGSPCDDGPKNDSSSEPGNNRPELPDEGDSVQPPSTRFAKLRDELRALLDGHDLPTDQEPSWIKSELDAWRPLTQGEAVLDQRSIYDWYEVVALRTEVNSLNRAAGVLLYRLIAFLNLRWIDQGLLMELLAAHTDYNALKTNVVSFAYGVTKARNGLAEGPAAKHKKANARRKIVDEHMRVFWLKNPSYHGDASNTAAQIADAVNYDIRANNLLTQGKVGLSIKTIGDHIRAIKKS
jgi:hypothetical protein